VVVGNRILGAHVTVITQMNLKSALITVNVIRKLYRYQLSNSIKKIRDQYKSSIGEAYSQKYTLLIYIEQNYIKHYINSYYEVTYIRKK
jgi:hypothetical protein